MDYIQLVPVCSAHVHFNGETAIHKIKRGPLSLMASDSLVQSQLKSTWLISSIRSAILPLSSYRVKFVILGDFLMALVI